MNTHKNACLTVHSRHVRVHRVSEQGLRPVDVAQAMAVRPRTVYKWLARYRNEGWAGLWDRSCRPHRCPHRTSGAQQARIRRLRRQRRIYSALTRQTGVPRATGARVLQRGGLNRLSARDPAPPVRRYEHDAPGDRLHLDIKKVNRFARPGHRVTGDRRGKSRGAGWDYLHMAIDDHSRVAHATIWPDETGASAVRALIAALRYYRRLGVQFKAVLTDNGACYQSRRFATACRRLGLEHKRTRPYRPRTNGKAERWIQTALHESAYAHGYQNADERADYLPYWLHDYNWHRPHASLNHQPPISRLRLNVNNVVGLHT
ncbi:IS481 family transposase [Salinisphaera hydrothermalis]|uniref:Integrase catalytic subunit n=1 Tax=Salinisphaera hydrothermalis (strain C41B8) TaxID=1304275 RepID=A0A084IN12_SALHC|nr:IS481 family transposase [Salinisphaera hydrothermalis]KEZ78096.1 integrase catalytic subunit [Salinisphaera hydrothermalis C41B8]